MSVEEALNVVEFQAVGTGRLAQAAVVLANEVLRLQRGTAPSNEMLRQRAEDAGADSVPVAGDWGADPARRVQDAIEVARANGRASVSLLQRRLRIRYTEAESLVHTLVEQGVVSGPAGMGGYYAVVPGAAD